MSTVDDILKHERKAEEDYYAILGCDESATVSTLIILRYQYCHDNGSGYNQLHRQEGRAENLLALLVTLTLVSPCYYAYILGYDIPAFTCAPPRIQSSFLCTYVVCFLSTTRYQIN